MIMDILPTTKQAYDLAITAMSDEIQALRAKVASAEVFNLEQILHDPENQPSQYGTVPLEWYENLENKINRIRFNVEQVIDSITGGSDMYAIRKQLQTAVANKSLATYDKLSELNMTQNNEREKLDVRYFNEKLRLVLEGLPNYTRSELARELQRLSNTASPISQNEQQEVIAEWKVGEFYSSARPSKVVLCLSVGKQIQRDEKHHSFIRWVSPLKQAIPDGWKPIETVPKDGTQVIIKCSGGRVATAFYDDKPFVGEGWHVVVPFLGGFGSGTDTFIYFPEDMPTHWMPLPAATLKEKG